MIRVLQVVTHMDRGGLETMLMNYYRHMDRDKVQFDFLTHRPYDGDFDEEIHALGGKIYHLPLLNPFSKSYLSKLDRFFKEHPEYSVIHVHQDCLGGVILKAAAKNGVPVRIAHSHNSQQTKDIKYPVKLVYRRIIPRYATDLFACGQESGNWMFCGAPFRVLTNAIDAQAFRFRRDIRKAVREELGISENDILVGHVGRFSLQKNHAYLIDIFSEIQKTRPARLLLVGDGEDRATIEEKVRVAGLSDKVIFAGLRTDVNRLLMAMDVFVMPSLYEGVSFASIEAQASGLPCIISDKTPLECDVTGKVRQIALDDGPGAWAEAVIEEADKIRENSAGEVRDTYDLICAAGYDITENAAKLERYYLRKWKKAEKSPKAYSASKSIILKNRKMESTMGVKETIKNLAKQAGGEVLTSTLMQRGMKVGSDFNRQQGCYIDPTHCFLIEIGNNVTFSVRVTVLAHDASMKKALGYTRLGKVVIGDNVFVGANATILPGVTIGDNSVVGANSVVTKSIPANSVAVGNPAKVISSLDDFVGKNKKLLESRKCFDAGYRFSSTLSEEKKKEIMAAVQDGFAFID